MEKQVASILDNAKISYRQEVYSTEYPELAVLGEDKKRFDFVIETNCCKYLMEVNFYSGGGSKLNEVCLEVNPFFKNVEINTVNERRKLALEVGEMVSESISISDIDCYRLGAKAQVKREEKNIDIVKQRIEEKNKRKEKNPAVLVNSWVLELLVFCHHKPFAFLFPKVGFFALNTTGVAHTDTADLITGTALYFQYSVNLIAVEIVKLDDQRATLALFIKANDNRHKFFRH